MADELTSLTRPRGPRPKKVKLCLWRALKSSLSSAANEGIKAPGLPDVLHAIFQAHRGETEWIILKADDTKSHRRMKVLRRGWRLQIAKLGRERFVNKVGACGMASAQLYWGRLVFVDDFPGS